MVVWNLNNIYDVSKTDEIIAELEKKVEQFTNIRSELKSDLPVKRFFEILSSIEEMLLISQKIGGYASLKFSEDTGSSENNYLYARMSKLGSEISNKILFFDLWFKSLSDEDAQKYLDSANKYHYYLSQIRSFKKYALKEKEEQIINLKDLTGSEVLTKLYDVITNKFIFDWKDSKTGEDKKISQAELLQNVHSDSPKERKLTYETLLNKYVEFKQELSELYQGIVLDWYNENVSIRKFESPISVRNLSNDVSDKIVNTLFKVTRKNISLFHDYFKVKAKLVGLEKLKRFDIYAPLKKIEKDYTFDESKKLVLDTYKEFSDVAHSYAKEVFDKENIHTDLTPGKRSGAFCYTIEKDMTPYVLQNYTGKIKDVFTMMHELGHAIHGRSSREQTQFTFHSSLPMAETASIFAETLLFNKLLNECSKDEKMSLLGESLDSHYASIVRQIYFVLFEVEAHTLISKGCTSDELNELYFALLKEQFGDSVEVPEIFKNEWMYIPHMFHTPFYCYAYGFGNLLALSLYGLYVQEGDVFVDKYMKLLAAGGSDSAENLFRDIMGIDISDEAFWQKGFDLIKEQLNSLEELVE